MNKETLFESFYAKAEKAIKKIGRQNIKDVYAISFWKDNLEDDPRCPVITIGYNTLTQVEVAQKNAASLMEAKWNYAFWLQNEVATIGGNDKNLRLYFKEANLFYTQQEYSRAEKNGEEDKAKDLLNDALNDKIIDKIFYNLKLSSLNAVKLNIDELYRQNADYEKNPEYAKAIVTGPLLVVGLPTSKDIFDTAKAMQIFSDWFETSKSQYPEFINLFFYLMQTDNRSYKR